MYFCLRLTLKLFNMKKSTLILMAALLIMAAGSCKKNENNENGNDNVTTNEGVYNPSQKIYKYYGWDSFDQVRELEQVWNWNGEKLSSIDYMEYDGTVYKTEYFTYDRNRLTRVDCDRTYLEFQYADGKLKKIIEYYDYELDVEFTITHGSNNKISMIKMAYMEEKQAKKERLNPLCLFLPEQVVGRYEGDRERRHFDRHAKDDGMEIVTIKLTWDGDNISKIYIEGEYSEDGYSETFSEDYVLFYDNKHNPKCGFMNHDFPGLEVFSANNIVKYICTECELEYENGVLVEDENDTYEYRYTYQYNEANYPIVIEETYSYKGVNTSTSKHFIEYK